MPVGTPFHERTFALCESLSYREWSGYYTVSSDETHHEHEYNAIRNAAALIDISPLFKYLVSGPDAARLVNRVITRDVDRMRVGQVFYTPWCDEEGMVIDDGTVARLGEQRFRWTAADPNLRWLAQNAAGMHVSLEDVSETTAALALQGPMSAQVLRACARIDIDSLKYFHVTSGTIGGIPVDISRTGYTGDLGYEIWVEAEQALPLWDALMAEGRGFGLTPAGLLALDIARVEAGFVLIGVDYLSAESARQERDTVSPYTLGLGWAVKLDKGTFHGREALQAERRNGGPPSRVVGLEVPWEPIEALYLGEAGIMPDLPLLACREPVPVYDPGSGRQIGRATTRVWSTLLKKYVALATVESPWAARGTEVGLEMTVHWKRRIAPARVVPTPFFRPERARA